LKKWSLICDSGGVWENRDSDRNENRKAYADEAADGNENSIESWARGQPCHVLPQYFFTLFSCL
jgi:hypothetical protein